VPGGFTKDDFTIDLQAKTVTCPAGQTVAITGAGKAILDWRCGPCPLRARCTTAKQGRTLNLHPHEAELVAARRAAADPAFQASYRRWRPMVERSIAWLVAKGTAGCATAAWLATSTACRYGWPRSTCAG
jgi:DDE family transposase